MEIYYSFLCYVKIREKKMNIKWTMRSIKHSLLFTITIWKLGKFKDAKKIVKFKLKEYLIVRHFLSTRTPL